MAYYPCKCGTKRLYYSVVMKWNCMSQCVSMKTAPNYLLSATYFWSKLNMLIFIICDYSMMIMTVVILVCEKYWLWYLTLLCAYQTTGINILKYNSLIARLSFQVLNAKYRFYFFYTSPLRVRVIHWYCVFPSSSDLVSCIYSIFNHYYPYLLQNYVMCYKRFPSCVVDI